MLAACTSESDNSPSAKISYETVVAAQQVPVTFGTYIGEQAITRAGTPGSIEAIPDDPATVGVDESKTIERVLANKGGFGVFAYYTFTGTWNSATGATDNGTYGGSVGTQITSPNFMYNQRVVGTDVDAPVWSYTPLKYWPNDYAAGNVGPSDGGYRAQGSKVSGVSFFAYAPYVLSPSVGTGITAFTANDAPGDPKVSYTVATTPDASVDLLWGVAGSSSVNTAGTAQTVTAGFPLVNQTKQTLTGNVTFAFNHALARLGLTVQAAKDLVAAGSSDSKELWDSDAANKTRIYVNSVTITSSMSTSGKLNLNNVAANTAKWEDLGVAASTTLTAAGSNLNPNLVYDNTKTLDDASQKPGVLAKSFTTLMQTAGEDVYFMLIPQTTAGTINVAIDYDVITQDANLASNGTDTVSKVNNVITKTISAINFKNGKAYTLNLVLGMTSVEVSATVSPWSNASDLDPVNLPINVN